ncbi:extracellular solute-binding protein [Paenibacillus sp. MER TA 81-3]|uniref:ABC transporter substrate-binding protein n=1 Tax=Paenibacillus sp. MER TA 81-3 TaxID=2939573 RepID=UPI00203B8D4A|nr:extracellular solute-binding protein [Paenibacillus sp. MER TA 81-3]MCM3340728.1 extracellular solute-binding protein [Paenibacillus sp. MER TA 81-3]
MQKKWRIGRIGIMLLTIMSLLSGCFGGTSELEPLKEGKGEIKVVYQDEDAFYRDYGNFFKMKYPDIDIEVISQTELFAKFGQGESFDFDEERRKLLDKYKPDVLLLDESMFEVLAQEGKLYNIEAAILQDKYDIEGFMSGLIDRIRAKGNGKLYGLAPYFETTVLYYNREIFKEHHIELPRNKMSWKELIDLAGRFSNIGSGDDQVYGFYQDYGGPEQLMYEIVASSGLRLFDAKAEKLLINSDGWKEAIKLATDAARNKSVYIPPQDENGNRLSQGYELFFKGQAAMMFHRPWFTRELKDRPLYEETAMKIDWDIVTTPVDPSTPDESANVRLSEIYAVAADSQNKRAAWELVKFVNGTDMARATSKTNDGRLPTRIDYFKELEGRSTEAFYLLKPKAVSAYEGLWGNKNVPEDFIGLFRPLLSEALQAIIDNQKTLDEAIAELEEKGQEALLKAHEAKKAS